MSAAIGRLWFLVLFAFSPALHAGKFADFNNDGRSDVFWRNSATGENYIYPMNGKAILGSEGYVRTVADQSWQVVGIGDFDGDGRADLLWRNAQTGQNYVYFMNGTAIAAEGYMRTVADQDWQVAGVGDFNHDGRDDVLWRNRVTGDNYIYLMNGLAVAGEGYIRSVADQNWQVVGVANFDDGPGSDILWRNRATGENYLYPMDGLSIQAGEGYLRTVADPSWEVAGVGDFDGDQRADILWRHRSSGQNYLYPMNGTAILAGEGYLRTVDNLVWRVAAVGDYDGDGRADILWRSVNGESYLYPMNGTQILAGEGYVRSVPAQWTIVAATRLPLYPLEPLAVNLATAAAAVDVWTGNQELEVASSCGGSTTIACPNGIPQSPPPRLAMTRSTVSVGSTASALQYTFSANVSIVSVSPIPVTINGLSCSLSVNTNPGASPTVTISGTAVFSVHTPPGIPDQVTATNVVVTGLVAEDLSLSGSFTCSLQSGFLGFMTGNLSSTLADSIMSRPLCGAPGPALFMACPGP